jgi:hypothetical protein
MNRPHELTFTTIRSNIIRHHNTKISFHLVNFYEIEYNMFINTEIKMAGERDPNIIIHFKMMLMNYNT